MNANANVAGLSQSRIHPLMAGAAAAVILFCATGIAAMTGILPKSQALTAPAGAGAVPTPSINPSEPIMSSVGPTTDAQGSRLAASPATARPAHHEYRAAQRAASRHAGDGEYASSPVATPRPALVDPSTGQVVAVTPVQTAQPSSGLGAVGGALVGGALGNQFGRGRGRTLATVAGALLGGLAGNTVEHSVRQQTSYDVQVRMADGSYRSITYQTPPSVQVGERVHLNGDALTAD